MNPYERRIVHIAVNEIRGVTTESLGDGFLKRVRVMTVPVRTAGRKRGTGKPDFQGRDAVPRGPRTEFRMLEDTIIAVATPSGRGGIAIVRLSGKNSLRISSRLFRPGRATLTRAKPRTAVFGRLRDGEGRGDLDEAILTFYPAPRSYTREDVVEIACHGSPVVVEEAVRLGILAGARQAAPGEFTLRAYLNGRLDLIQAEAVDTLIRSVTLAEARVAARQIDGSLSRRIARSGRMSSPCWPVSRRGSSSRRESRPGAGTKSGGRPQGLRRSRGARPKPRCRPGPDGRADPGGHGPAERRKIHPVQRPSRGRTGDRHAFPGNDQGLPSAKRRLFATWPSTWSIWPASAGPGIPSKPRALPAAGASRKRRTDCFFLSTPPAGWGKMISR